MKWLALILRILVGVPMVVFGVNYFAPFIPLDMKNTPEQAQQMMGILIASKWMVVVKLCEIVGGVMVLVGRFVPLGLVILVPVTVNIAIWDAVILKYSMPPLGTVLLVLEIVLIYLYRSQFESLFQANAKIG